MKNDNFGKLLNDELVNGIKLCAFDSDDYEAYSLDTLDENEFVDGVEYQPHYAFINIENEECPYVGMLYRDVTGEHDVKFRVIGAKYEEYYNGGWCEFDTMLSMLCTQ